MEQARKVQQNRGRSRRAAKVQKKPIKVTYISSPIEVKASSPSEFRAIVQELTGFHSGAPPCLDAWTTDRINDVGEAVHSISAIDPMLADDDLQGLIWREASEHGLPSFQFPSVFA